MCLVLTFKKEISMTHATKRKTKHFVQSSVNCARCTCAHTHTHAHSQPIILLTPLSRWSLLTEKLSAKNLFIWEGSRHYIYAQSKWNGIQAFQAMLLHRSNTKVQLHDLETRLSLFFPPSAFCFSAILNLFRTIWFRGRTFFFSPPNLFQEGF